MTEKRHLSGRRRGRHLGRLGLRARAGLALGVVLCVGVTGTFAYWTDTATVTGTTLGAGRLDLKVNGSDTLTAYGDLSLANMVPGNSTAGVLTVSNAGTVPLTYYATSTSSNSAMTTHLTVRVTNGTVAGSLPTETCTGTVVSPSGTGFGGTLIGTGAAERTLAPGTNETFCIQATLSTGAPSSLQGQNTNVTFTFQASQVMA